MVAVAGSAAFAAAADCSNTCVTMAIPSSPDGVYTKLDGTADAALWPPTHELRTIRISALNNRAAECDVTINDVRQDEAPGVAGSGAKIDDAVNCNNEGHQSSVQLRSDRADSGDGRGYQISFHLDDPDCSKQVRTDEVLVVVPRDQSVARSLWPALDESTLTASYSGSALQCTPPQRDARLE
jgi:hypothetical protein